MSVSPNPMPSPEFPSIRPTPIWEWKVGKRVWLSLPTGLGLGATIFQLVTTLAVAAESLVVWLADFGHDSHRWFSRRWIWVAVFIGCFPQIVLQISSLWALRIQKRRKRFTPAEIA
jgi:hypothetical protein